MATCSAVKVSQHWAAGYTDDDIHLDRVTPDQQDALYKQFKNNKYGMVQIGNKWVELPDCAHGMLTGDDVPLKEDLSNAIIATCKAYNPTATTTTTTSTEPTAVESY